MLNWILDKFFGRRNVYRSSNPMNETREDNLPRQLDAQSQSIMADKDINNSDNKMVLHIIYEGDVWTVRVHHQDIVAELISMALSHFFGPCDVDKTILNSDYKLISVPQKRALLHHCTVIHEELCNNDEVLLLRKLSSGIASSQNLSTADIKGPSKEAIIEATSCLTTQRPIHAREALDCQENFQSEIRKVLYSLVEVSAKILAQSPDAKAIFDMIAARINAKSKKDVDKNSIKYLKDLGFTEIQAKYALRLKRNRQVEAMEWLLENSDLVTDSLVEGSEQTTTASQSSALSSDPICTITRLLEDIQEFHYQHFEPNAKAMENLQGMGFAQDAVLEALRITSNNQVAACEWLCGERQQATRPGTGLDKNSSLYKALISNPAIQLGLHMPKIMLAFLSILENPSSANLWLNDVDTAPVLGQVFKTYHSEKHIMLVNHQE